jgi:hypothetical protein
MVFFFDILRALSGKPISQKFSFHFRLVRPVLVKKGVFGSFSQFLRWEAVDFRYFKDLQT